MLNNENFSDYPCDKCNKHGVSVVDSFLPIGKCYYCGYQNKMVKCDKCDELIPEDSVETLDDLKGNYCSSCAEDYKKFLKD